MSLFGVFAERIATVANHFNAERLDICTLEGIDYPFVTGRDQYKPGDPVLYFPPDAIIPDEVATKMGVLHKLGGKMKNRVKAVKIRGAVSQGLVASPSLFPDAVPTEGEKPDYAAALGIIKYDQEEHTPGGPNNPQGTKLFPLPPGVTKYDLENAERYRDVVDAIKDDVVITEKIEGSHIAVTKYGDGKVVVCSRGQGLTDEHDTPGNWYYEGARNSGLFEKLDAMWESFDTKCQMTIRGEVIGPGIQKNIYDLPARVVLAFEIEHDGTPIDADDFFSECYHFDISAVPNLFEGKLDDYLKGQSLRDASNGPSVLKSTQLREGIVIKPRSEKTVHHFGRAVVKQRSPEYLSKSEL